MSSEAPGRFIIRQVGGSKVEYEREEIYGLQDLFLRKSLEFLRKFESVPNHNVNSLMDITGGLLEDQELDILINNDNREEISFSVDSENEFSGIIVPYNFQQRLEDDPVGQLARLVRIGSQIRDHWMDDYIESKGIGNSITDKESRADAYEAEFLKTIVMLYAKRGHSFVPDERQRQLLTKYPNGLSRLDGTGVHYFTPVYSSHGPYVYGMPDENPN